MVGFSPIKLYIYYIQVILYIHVVLYIYIYIYIYTHIYYIILYSMHMTTYKKR